jgi:hypothetical protein
LQLLFSKSRDFHGDFGYARCFGCEISGVMRQESVRDAEGIEVLGSDDLEAGSRDERLVDEDDGAG